jgi:hypothetical protein
MEKRSERINYEDVANICTLLKSANIEPSVRKIYSILESGSNSTITKYFEKWLKEESNRKIKLSINITRLLESEIENEALKMSNNARSENIKLSQYISQLEDELLIRNNKIEKLELNLNREQEQNQKNNLKLTTQIDAEKLETKAYKEKCENLLKENREILSKSISIETQYMISKENEKKLETKIVKLENEKEKLLLQIGSLQAKIIKN